MNIYLEAFSIFFKIGAFTIGGGYAMVPLIENEIVTKRNWIAKEDFIDLLAISQSAPGILAVNISIFIGYRLRGIRGSIITALGRKGLSTSRGGRGIQLSKASARQWLH